MTADPPGPPGCRASAPRRAVRPDLPSRSYVVPLPRTPLLSTALPNVDWSDAFAVDIPIGAHARHPQEWVDVIFRAPPVSMRVLFGLRNLVVRAVGIEVGGHEVFATVSRRPNEVLLGTDQRHLAFRASVLVEDGRVVLTTVVDVRSRRGLAYSAIVRRIHPLVVRSLLARAARTMAASGEGPPARRRRSTRTDRIAAGVAWSLALMAGSGGGSSQAGRPRVQGELGEQRSSGHPRVPDAPGQAGPPGPSADNADGFAQVTS